MGPYSGSRDALAHIPRSIVFGMTEIEVTEKDQLERLEQLRQENLALEQEAGQLREFMDSMVKLIEAVERPKRESEALTLLNQVLDSAIRAIGARDGSLLVPDEETGELMFVLVQGQSTKDNLVGRRLPAGRGIAGWVVRHGEPSQYSITTGSENISNKESLSVRTNGRNTSRSVSIFNTVLPSAI